MPSELRLHQRLHPASILFAFAASLKKFALPAVLGALATARSSEAPPEFAERWLPFGAEMTNWQFWLLLFLIPSALIAIARYVSFRLRYDGTEIVIRTGIFFRNERHLPYLRIQNLNEVRNIAHRLLGVTEVRIETGGGANPEATISVLHASAFDEMRRRVFEGRSRASALAGVATDTEPVSAASAPTPDARSETLLHLPVRELLLLGFLEDRGTILLAAAVGGLWNFGLFDVIGDRLRAQGWWTTGLLGTAFGRVSAGGSPTLVQVGAVGVVLVGGLLAMRALSMAWAATRLYDFRLTRFGWDLRTEYGLLTHVATTIPLHRVQTLTLRESPLQRLAGRMSVQVETAGGHMIAPGSVKREREWLAPIVRASDVAALAHEVIPTLDLDAVSWQRVDPRAFRRAVKPALLIGLAVTAPFIGMLGWRGLAFLPLTLGWMTFVSWKQVQRLGWAVTDDEVMFRSGWLWRSVTVAPIGKIQVVACTESPFDRRSIMAKLSVDTAGAHERSHRVSIPYLPRQTASSLHQRLSAQAAQTAFPW